MKKHLKIIFISVITGWTFFLFYNFCIAFLARLANSQSGCEWCGMSYISYMLPLWMPMLLAEDLFEKFSGNYQIVVLVVAFIFENSFFIIIGYIFYGLYKIIRKFSKQLINIQ